MSYRTQPSTKGLQTVSKFASPAAKRRFAASFYGRVAFRNVIEQWSCGCVAAAALRATDPARRAALEKEALRQARRAPNVPSSGGIIGCSTAILACLRGDRSGVVAAMRTWLAHPPLSPLGATLSRRRLGELLDDDEGRALIAQADAALRAGGVVDPARFVATMYPGVELR